MDGYRGVIVSDDDFGKRIQAASDEQAIRYGTEYSMDLMRIATNARLKSTSFKNRTSCSDCTCLDNSIRRASAEAAEVPLPGR